jgi:hypothetical protein
MFSLLQIRRSGQAEAVSADLILFGNSLWNPVAIRRITLHTSRLPRIADHLLGSLSGFKRGNIDPSSRPVALQHGVEDFELAQSIDELRVLGRSTGCAG